MLKKQKVIAGIGALVMMASACAVSASAVNLNAHLAASETVKYSAKANSQGGNYLWGSNNSLSAFNVYAVAKYQVGLIWNNGGELTLAPGQEKTMSPSRFQTVRTWQLGLNPVGANKYGCIADGELSLM